MTTEPLRLDKHLFAATVSREALERGGANVIALNAMRDRVGERWEKLADSVHHRLESILRRKLSPADSFMRLTDAAYLVSMPLTGRDEARVTCVAVAMELHNRLFGKCDVGSVELLAAARCQDDGIAFAAIEPAEIRRLALRSGLSDIPPISGPGGCMPEAPARNTTVGVHTFRPLWDAGKQVVIGYRCVLRAEAAASHPDPLLPQTERIVVTAPAQRKARAHAGAAISAMHDVVALAARHIAHGERFFFDIPLHYEALSCPITRMELAAACRDLPAELRPYLLFEITDVPRGVPHGRLEDLAATVKPFCKGLIVHVPLRDRVPMPHTNLFQAVALDIPRYGMAPQEARSELEHLHAEASRLKLMAVLTNVADPVMLRMALAAGVNLLSGPLFGTVADPGPMHRLAVHEIVPDVSISDGGHARLSA